MEHDEIVALKNQVSATFTIDQLRQVVWEAGVDPENIAHTNLSSLARETANHFKGLLMANGRRSTTPLI